MGSQNRASFTLRRVLRPARFCPNEHSQSAVFEPPFSSAQDFLRLVQMTAAFPLRWRKVSSLLCPNVLGTISRFAGYAPGIELGVQDLSPISHFVQMDTQSLIAKRTVLAPCPPRPAPIISGGAARQFSRLDITGKL